MLGLPYERPARLMADYLDVLAPALAGPGPVDVENESFRVHNPLDVTDVVPTPVLLAALGPVMLRIAGERTDGTILWMADERAIADHVVPHLTKAAAGAGRPTPRIVAGVPVCLCLDSEVEVAVERTNRILAEAEISPNYQRLLDAGDAQQVSDLLAAGSEAAVEKRLRSFADAGATDLSIRVVSIGEDRDALAGVVGPHPPTPRRPRTHALRTGDVMTHTRHPRLRRRQPPLRDQGGVHQVPPRPVQERGRLRGGPGSHQDRDQRHDQ